MKAYKASNNQVCKNQRYEVGETYTIDGPLEMCYNGFHFCYNPDDVFNYYSLIDSFVLFEVEPLGEIITEDDKSVTDKIKIIRIIPKKEWKNLFVIHKFDENENCIYFKDSYGFEYWQEYDENNKLIHYKDSDGDEEWHEYDKNNNEIHYKDSNGYEEWYENNENNNLIHYKNSKGFEIRYDENGKIIH